MPINYLDVITVDGPGSGVMAIPYHPLADPYWAQWESRLIDPAGAGGVPGTSLDGDGDLSIAILKRGAGGVVEVAGYFEKQKDGEADLIDDFPGQNLDNPANAGKALVAHAGAVNAGTSYLSYQMPHGPDGRTVFIVARRGAAMAAHGADRVRPLIQMPGPAIDGDTSQKVFVGPLDVTADPAQTLICAGSHLNDPNESSTITGWAEGDTAIFIASTDAGGTVLRKDACYAGDPGGFFGDVNQLPGVYFIAGCEISGASPNATIVAIFDVPAPIAELDEGKVAQMLAWCASRGNIREVLPIWSAAAAYAEFAGPWAR
jgi:hypothetical protein